MSSCATSATHRSRVPWPLLARRRGHWGRSARWQTRPCCGPTCQTSVRRSRQRRYWRRARPPRPIGRGASAAAAQSLRRHQRKALPTTPRRQFPVCRRRLRRAIRPRAARTVGSASDFTTAARSSRPYSRILAHAAEQLHSLADEDIGIGVGFGEAFATAIGLPFFGLRR